MDPVLREIFRKETAGHILRRAPVPGALRARSRAAPGHRGALSGVPYAERHCEDGRRPAGHQGRRAHGTLRPQAVRQRPRHGRRGARTAARHRAPARDRVGARRREHRLFPGADAAHGRLDRARAPARRRTRAPGRSGRAHARRRLARQPACAGAAARWHRTFHAAPGRGIHRALVAALERRRVARRGAGSRPHRAARSAVRAPESSRCRQPSRARSAAFELHCRTRIPSHRSARISTRTSPRSSARKRPNCSSSPRPRSRAGAPTVPTSRRSPSSSDCCTR